MNKVYVILIDDTVWSYSKNKDELYASYMKLKQYTKFYKEYKHTIKILTFGCKVDITDRIERELDYEINK